VNSGHVVKSEIQSKHINKNVVIIISKNARNKYFPGNETTRESSVFTA
jgi:hypothetical protein